MVPDVDLPEAPREAEAEPEAVGDIAPIPDPDQVIDDMPAIAPVLADADLENQEVAGEVVPGMAIGVVVPAYLPEIAVIPAAVPNLEAANDPAVVEGPREAGAVVGTVDGIAPILPNIVEEAMDVLPLPAPAPVVADLAIPRLAGGAPQVDPVNRRLRLPGFLGRAAAFLIRLSRWFLA